MDERHRDVWIKVPESNVGPTIAELCRIGSTIKGLSDAEPLHTIYAEMPSDEISAFQVWLADTCPGVGFLLRNQPSNDEDA